MVKMMREKIKIKKIDYLPARQVTFSKRRRGLFKKAAELSVLCESEVAVVMFSATGKLFDYSSSSPEDFQQEYECVPSSKAMGGGAMAITCFCPECMRDRVKTYFHTWMCMREREGENEMLTME